MSSLWILLLLLALTRGAGARLQAYGCEEGWTNYLDHCYTVALGKNDASSAHKTCVDLGAKAASVWAPAEKAIILSLGQKDMELMWLGLTGSDQGDWQWEDNSKVKVVQEDTGSHWSILDDAVDLPDVVSDKCLAVGPAGGLAFLDCRQNLTAVACKKALPKVYVWASLVNRSSPVAVSPLDSVQLFERLLPPELSSLPSSSNPPLAEATVATDRSCAFKCYGVASCRVMELSCRTADHCRSFQCLLFDGL